MRSMPSVPSRVWLSLAISLALLLGSPVGLKTAEAAPSCSASVSNASFASLDLLNAATLNTTATLSFSCSGMTPGVPVTLCPNLDGGSAGSNGSGGRRLAGPSGGVLSFQIYQDAARTQTWGSSSFLAFGGAPTITMTPGISGSASTTRTLYASVTGAAGAVPGTYSTSFSNQNFFWGLNLLTCAGVTVGFAAVPATFSFDVAAPPDCGVTATNLAFGTIGLLSQAVAAQNQISVRCTASTPWTLGLNNGLRGSAPDNRQMANGSARVRYGIYKDAANTQAWGDATMGASAVQSGVGTGGAQTLTGYGRAPVQATPEPGSYTDTVVAQITY